MSNNPQPAPDELLRWKRNDRLILSTEIIFSMVEFDGEKLCVWMCWFAVVSIGVE